MRLGLLCFNYSSRQKKKITLILMAEQQAEVPLWVLGAGRTGRVRRRRRRRKREMEPGSRVLWDLTHRSQPTRPNSSLWGATSDPHVESRQWRSHPLAPGSGRGRGGWRGGCWAELHGMGWDGMGCGAEAGRGQGAGLGECKSPLDAALWGPSRTQSPFLSPKSGVVLRDMVYCGNVGGRWAGGLDHLGGLFQHCGFNDSMSPVLVGSPRDPHPPGDRAPQRPGHVGFTSQRLYSSSGCPLHPRTPTHILLPGLRAVEAAPVF